MQPYRISLLFFAGTVAVFFLGVAIIVWMVGDPFPAPRISDNVSFNQKALWLRHAFEQHHPAEIIVAGSSMGLNNLAGEDLARITGTPAILNTCSWGLTLPQSLHVLHVVLDQEHPKIVILPIYLGDFEKPKDTLDWPRFRECLFATSLAPLYLESLDGLYYEKTYREQKAEKVLNRQDYYSLHFDAYGGVPLAARDFSYDPKRWNGQRDQTLDQIDWDPEALADLREMASFLHRRKIAFLVVACPMRHVMEQKFGPQLDAGLWAKVSTILNESGGRFVHISGPEFDDSLFVDYAHVNLLGARKIADLLAPDLTRLQQAQTTW